MPDDLDLHDDIRRRLFDAAWDVPAYPPEPRRTVDRARRRAATTLGGAALAAFVAIVVAASSLPFEPTERTGGPPATGDDLDFLVDLRTGASTEIHGLVRVYWPDVHPDGNRLVYATDASGSPQIWVSNLDGSGAERLTDDPYGAEFPRWSPTGDRIAYVGFGAAGTSRQVFVLDAATGDTERLTHSAATRDAWAPSWSPDGGSIAYHVPIRGQTQAADDHGTSTIGSFGYQVRIVDVRTREVRVVAGGKHTTAFDPTWIPGGRLAFVWASDHLDAPEHQGLYAETPDPRAPERLLALEDAHQAWTPTTSPDGRRIAFVQNVDGVESVFVYDLLTGDARRIRSGFVVTWVDDDTLLVQQRAPEGPGSTSS